jgi:ubiquinone/menaquinone biosynthesis C-methylase UbiE
MIDDQLGWARRFRPGVALVAAVSHVAPALKPRVQKLLIRAGYQLVNRPRFSADSTCMNYGYAALDETETPGEYRPDHYGLQLYAKVAGAVDLAGMTVLEVGCGRGGGSAYVAESLCASTVTGVDFARRGVAWCRRRHHSPGLHFVHADAEALPFADRSFDAVVNVESSHCYPHTDRFFDEVHRVLQPSGYLLFADLRPASAIAGVREESRAAGFTVLEDELITPNVLRALQLDTARRVEIIERSVPRPLRSAVREFMAVEGSEIFEQLRRGELEYLRLVLRAV